MKLLLVLIFLAFGSMANADVLLGAWVKTGSPGSIGAFEKQIGRSLSIVHRFYAWNDKIPTHNEKIDNKLGKLSLVTWELYGSSLQAIIDGKQDKHIRKRAREFKSFGDKIFLRFGHEMNGNWYPWGGQPEMYKEAYRRVHNLFIEEGAFNVIWVWCPNIMSVPNEPWNDMQKYYPGDEYVDWIAADGYNWGRMASHFQWQSFEDIFSEFHARYGGKKPLMIAETSSTEVGGDKGLWIRELKEDLTKFPHLKALIWFEEKKETDWRASSSPDSLRAFRNLVKEMK